MTEIDRAAGSSGWTRSPTPRPRPVEVDVRMEIPGAVIRQRTGFGDASGSDTISGEYFTLSEGVDTTPLFEGLEGDLCQCPHWGFVLRGQLTTTDAKGAQETVAKDDLFYWPPGTTSGSTPTQRSSCSAPRTSTAGSSTT